MNQNLLDQRIGNVRLNGFHLTILFWCSILMLFDGYDLVIYGSILPHLMEDLSLSPIAAGIIGSSALFGMMIGALIFSTTADKIGRRKVILICLVFFSTAAFLNAFCADPVKFTICRFLTGVGLGGMVPNIVALMTEMAPPRHRNTLVTVMLSFYSVGGILAALLAKEIAPIWGWRANFMVAGFSLLAFPILYRVLPESLSFLLEKGQTERAEPILHRYAPDFKGGVGRLRSTDAIGVPGKTGLTAAQLFTDGRGLMTLLLWVSFGVCMLMVYGLNTWLPKLMAANGHSLGASLGFLITLNIGAVLGGLFSGWLADRCGGKVTLILFFLVATLSIALLGYRQTEVVMTALLMTAGATTVGTLCIVHAFAAQLYPASMRSTGVGWASAAGRFGAVAGPTLGGYLMSQHVSVTTSFLIFAVPGVIAAIAVFFTTGRAVGEREQLHLTQQPSAK